MDKATQAGQHRGQHGGPQDVQDLVEASEVVANERVVQQVQASNCLLEMRY